MTHRNHRTDITSSKRGTTLNMRRATLIFLAISLLVTTLIPISAFAQIGTASPEDQARSNTYYATLRLCVRNNMYDDIQLASSDNGVAKPSKWFDNNDAYGYVYPDGKTDCKDIVGPAMQLWGYGTDYSAFLKDMGYFWDASAAKWTIQNHHKGVSSQDYRDTHFSAAIQSKYYNLSFAGDPSFSGEAKYALYLNTFVKACGAKDLGPLSDITNSSQIAWLDKSTPSAGYAVSGKLAGDPGAATVKFSKINIATTTTNSSGDASNKPVLHGYSYNSETEKWDAENFSSVYVYGYHGRRTATILTCDQLQKGINDNVNAYLNWLTHNPGKIATPSPVSTIDSKNDTSQEAPDCSPDMGLGWIICPTVNFLASMADTAKGFIDNAMTVNTLQIFKPAKDNGAYNAWIVMRNIANVLFIMAFLFMIYSQITGFGISNYALKKMLPRLVVAAILINASYYICVAGVEISNVLGQGLDSLISAGQCGGNSTSCIQVNSPKGGPVATVAADLSGLAAMALAIGVATYFFLPMVISVIVYVAFIAMAAAVLLGIRQALILLLVIVSPLAFVAYLLPNTEALFKKWWGLFKGLLLLYPIFGLLYGAGKLAAHILGQPDLGWEMNIFGYIALFSGLLVLPKLLEGAMSLGGIASIVGKMQNKAQTATNNKIQKSNAMAARQARMDRRRVNRKTGNGVLANWGRRRGGRVGAAAEYLGTTSSRISGNRFGRYMGMDRGTAGAVAEQNRLNNEAIERSMAVLTNDTPGNVVTNAVEQLKRANSNGDFIAARAATRVLAKQTGSHGVDVLHNTLSELESASKDGRLDEHIIGSVQNEVNSAGLKSVDRSLDQWSRGNSSVDSFDKDPSIAAGLNESELAGQSETQLTRLNISKEQAQRVLEAHKNSTIHLSDAKLNILRGKAGPMPTIPPSSVPDGKGAPIPAASKEYFPNGTDRSEGGLDIPRGSNASSRTDHK